MAQDAQEPLQLTLDDAITRARAASPHLRALDAQRRAAEADATRAGAARRPDVDVTAGYTRLSDVPEFGLPQPDGSQRTIFPNIPDNFSGRVGFSMPLYTGGRLESSLAAAQRQSEAAGADAEAGDADVVLETSRAYWNLVVARERVKVVAEAIAAFDAHLGDVRNRQTYGLAASSDVLAVQVERDRAELRRLEADQASAIAEADLQRLLDLAPATKIEPVEPLGTSEPIAGDVEVWVGRALAGRPERAALQSRIAAAEAAVAVERAALKPQIRASAGYDLAQPNRRILPPEDTLDDSWDVGVSLSYNLFDGGKRRAGVAAAEARAEAARQRLADLDRGLRLEVTARYLELATARASITVAETAVASARENVRVAGDRYREGLVPSSELLDAENGLLAAQLDHTAAQARWELAQAGFRRAVGLAQESSPPNPLSMTGEGASGSGSPFSSHGEGGRGDEDSGGTGGGE